MRVVRQMIVCLKVASVSTSWSETQPLTSLSVQGRCGQCMCCMFPVKLAMLSCLQKPAWDAEGVPPSNSPTPAFTGGGASLTTHFSQHACMLSSCTRYGFCYFPAQTIRCGEAEFYRVACLWTPTVLSLRNDQFCTVLKARCTSHQHTERKQSTIQHQSASGDSLPSASASRSQVKLLSHASSTSSERSGQSSGTGDRHDYVLSQELQNVLICFHETLESIRRSCSLQMAETCSAPLLC